MYEYQLYQDFQLTRNNMVAYPSHFHMHCELMFILSGEVHVTVDGKTYIAKRNDGIFIPPHQIHSYKRYGDVEVFTTFISPLFLTEYADKMNDNVPASPVLHLSDFEDAELCRYLFETVEYKVGKREPVEINTWFSVKDIALRSLVKSAVLVLLENCEWIKRQAPEPDLACKILNYCIEHYKNDISVSEIAAALGVSEHAVTRIFSSIFRCGFRSYINSLRIAKAAERLISGNEPITEIAFSVGYLTLRTFNRAFLSEKGITPSDFRRQHGKFLTSEPQRQEVSEDVSKNS